MRFPIFPTLVLGKGTAMTTVGLRTCTRSARSSFQSTSPIATSDGGALGHPPERSGRIGRLNCPRCAPVATQGTCRRQSCRVRADSGSRGRRGKHSKRAVSAGGHFEAGEDAAEVGAVIAVVEQADVPAAAELVEERHQRAGALGKLEAADDARWRLRGCGRRPCAARAAWRPRCR